MSSKEYNGWKNWETWNLMLHLDNTHTHIIDDFMAVNCGIIPTFTTSSGNEYTDFRECEEYIKNSFEDLYNGKIEDRFFIDNHHICWREIVKAIYEKEEWKTELKLI